MSQLDTEKLPPRAPPLEQASKPGPPFYVGLGFEAETDSGFEFDQSVPDDD